jgi:hypothetical protein
MVAKRIAPVKAKSPHGRGLSGKGTAEGRIFCGKKRICLDELADYR